MRISTVHPENYVVTSIEEIDDNRNMHQDRGINFRPTRRCIRIGALIIAVALVIICAIVIPLAITLTRKKNTSQPTTVQKTESATSLETIIITQATATEPTETISSSTSNDTIAITTAMNTMVSTESVDSGSIKTISTDTSTKTSFANNASTATNSTSNAWTHSAMSTIISITNITTKNPTTTSNESKSTTETTTVRPTIALNQVNDVIIGLYNTTAGQSIGGFNGVYTKANHTPHNAMDNSTLTKYFNYGHNGGNGKKVHGAGIGTGFLVIPSVSNATVACGLLFATGGNQPDRDPITVTLEGSNVTIRETLNDGSSWTLIYNGSTGIDAIKEPSRRKYGIQQNFSNEKRFASYRLLITSQRNDSDAVQYSEARIIGYV